MSRIDVLFQHPKRTLGVLALVLVAVGVAVGSAPNFWLFSANPSSRRPPGPVRPSTGKLSEQRGHPVGRRQPGLEARRQRTVRQLADIQNTGSLAGTFSLSRSALSDTTTPNDTPSGPSPAPADPLSSEKIDLVVKDCGDFSIRDPAAADVWRAAK